MHVSTLGARVFRPAAAGGGQESGPAARPAPLWRWLLATFLLVPTTAAQQPTARTAAVDASHQRMLDALETIRKEALDSNPWLGEAPARAARDALAAAADAPAGTRFRLLVDLAEEELRLGDEPAALERFDEAYELMSESPASLGNQTEVLFRIAVAWLRYGESRNCAGMHTAAACILPIRGEAIHREREGSEQAARFFREYLAAVPPNSVQQVKAKWLLNLAHMTLGDHPAAVKPEHRLPLAAFGSAADFPRFINVAPELGIDSFNLSGGAVVDDLDGDLDLDIFTTTFDPAGSPRLFLNDGQGEFTDASTAAGLDGLYGGLNVVHGDVDNDGDLDLFVLRGAWFGPPRPPSELAAAERVGRRRRGQPARLSGRHLSLRPGRGPLPHADRRLGRL